MSILIQVTEESNRQGTHNTPVTKLYGVPFINNARGFGSKTKIFIGDNKEERLVSESYSTINPLVNSGYIDFLIPVTVKEVSGNINDNYPYPLSLKASSIIEVYEEEGDSSDSVIRYRSESNKEDILYTVDETLAGILALLPNKLTGFSTYKREFTQAEVRTLFSANGGFGHVLLAAPGVDKYYQIINPIFTFKISASGTLVASTINLYPTSGTSTYLQVMSGITSIPGVIRIYQPGLNNSSASGATNEDHWLWLDVESPGYKGTLVVTFDYKLIDGATL